MQLMHEAWTNAQHMVQTFVLVLPRLMLAAVLFALFYLLGRSIRAVVRRGLRRTTSIGPERRTLVMAVGRLVQGVILLVGLLVAVTAAIPSFTLGNLVSTLGIGGVAIGFAFKDIFQNFLAGILLLVTRPFVVGDQIVFGNYEGTVEDIQTRATFIKMFDGRRVIVPNGELFTHSFTVNTAFAVRRTQFDVGIGYGDDIARAKEIIMSVLTTTDGVLALPQPDVIVVNLAESSVMLRARWWSESLQRDVLLVQDAVLTEIKLRLTAAGIDLPFPTQVVLYHVQTDESDGDRRVQREGWPAGAGPVPGRRPRVPDK